MKNLVVYFGYLLMGMFLQPQLVWPDVEGHFWQCFCQILMVIYSNTNVFKWMVRGHCSHWLNGRGLFYWQWNANHFDHMVEVIIYHFNQMVDVIAGNANHFDQTVEVITGNANCFDQMIEVITGNISVICQMVEVIAGNINVICQMVQVIAGNIKGQSRLALGYK